MKLKNHRVLNEHAPGSLAAVQRFWSDEEKHLLFHSRNLGDDLQAARAAIAADMKTILDRAENDSRGLSEDEQTVWDELQDWVELIDSNLKQCRVANLPEGIAPVQLLGGGHTQSNLPTDKDQPLTREQSCEDWCRRHLPGCADQQQNQPELGDLLRCWITGEGSDVTRRAMQTTSDGGILIPTLLSARIIDTARNKAQTLNAGVQTLPMPEKTLTIPRVRSDPQAAWRAEMGLIKRSGAAFEPVTLSACSLACIVPMSRELFEDNAVGLGVWFQVTLGKVLALAMDQAVLTGSGAKVDGTRIEPIGITNTEGIQTLDLSQHDSGSLAKLPNYLPFSKAVTMVRAVNGEPGAVIMSPNNFGIVDALSDTTGQPLQPPQSWQSLQHLDSNQVEDSLAFVGDFRQAVMGIRQQLHLEIASTGTVEKDGDLEAVNLLQQHALAIKVVMRGDVGIQRPDHFVQITNINNTVSRSSKPKAA